MKPGLALATCAAAVVLLIGAFHAGAFADATSGRIFVQANCSRCHNVGNGISPLAKVPNFATLSRRYRPSDLEEAFAEGIVTGHPGMPEFTLTPRQIDDLVAYLRRLRAR
ncbi:MAG: c-type cytochrome [Beijerinckiaceae bacterium]